MIEKFTERIITREDTKQKVQTALGFDAYDVPDTVRRENFNSDAEYLNAATRAIMEQKDPEYRRVYSQLSRQLAQQREAEQAEREWEELKQIRAGIRLDELEQKNVDAEARRMAQGDLAAGRIFAGDMGAAIEKYAERLTEQAKNSKAHSQQMNARLRSLFK